MQSRMTIKYTSYGDIEKTTIYQILKYFTTPRKGVLFRLDFDKENETGWDEEDIYISSLAISKFEGATSNEKYSKEYYVTFMCDNKEQKYLLKLLFAITQHGDPGHILKDDGHKKFAEKIAKKYSEFQYNKFAQIKNELNREQEI